MPQSSYGVRPVNRALHEYGGVSARKQSANTSKLSKLNTSAQSFNKEASVKNLRMGNFMSSASSFAQQSPAPRKASLRQSRTLAQGKSRSRGLAESKYASRQSLVEVSQDLIAPYPKIEFKTDEDFAIRILDNMIQVEEDMAQGFSLYNRGKNLKKSLINPERVKSYLIKKEQADLEDRRAQAHAAKPKFQVEEPQPPEES